MVTRCGLGCVAQPLNRLAVITQVPNTVTNLRTIVFIVTLILQRLTGNCQLGLIPVYYGNTVRAVCRHHCYRCRHMPVVCATTSENYYKQCQKFFHVSPTSFEMLKHLHLTQKQIAAGGNWQPNSHSLSVRTRYTGPTKWIWPPIHCGLAPQSSRVF